MLSGLHMIGRSGHSAMHAFNLQDMELNHQIYSSPFLYLLLVAVLILCKGLQAAAL